MIEAKIIADSLGPFGNRIITYVLTFPRIVLAEFNTHRALSRNSASSRAIPLAKMLKMVRENPFIPIRWMKEHTGMQGNEYFEDEETIHFLEEEWLIARDYAAQQAEILGDWEDEDPHMNGGNGGYKKVPALSKQICNRLLEPFMWHTCICTATEWENFFALRAHPDAEIHIQELAHKMLEVANASVPKKLKAGEWHIPFGDNIDISRIFKTEKYENGTILQWKPMPVFEDWADEFYLKEKIKIATARCARVSYLNFEGKDDYEDDIRLYNRLLKAGHMSPFEHCAYAMNTDEYQLLDGWKGNFTGFYQLRKTIENENKKDERFIKK